MKLFYGAEVYRDSIESNNLGVHDRARTAPYVALDVRALRRFSFSVGLRDEIYGSFNHELSPTFAAGLLARACAEAARAVSAALSAFRPTPISTITIPPTSARPIFVPNAPGATKADSTGMPDGRLRAGADRLSAP